MVFLIEDISLNSIRFEAITSDEDGNRLGKLESLNFLEEFWKMLTICVTVDEFREHRETT